MRIGYEHLVARSIQCETGIHIPPDWQAYEAPPSQLRLWSIWRPTMMQSTYQFWWRIPVWRPPRRLSVSNQLSSLGVDSWRGSRQHILETLVLALCGNIGTGCDYGGSVDVVRKAMRWSRRQQKRHQNINAEQQPAPSSIHSMSTSLHNEA